MAIGVRCQSRYKNDHRMQGTNDMEFRVTPLDRRLLNDVHHGTCSDQGETLTINRADAVGLIDKLELYLQQNHSCSNRALLIPVMFRLMQKLLQFTGMVPESLDLDFTFPSHHAEKYGGYADVYRAEHNGSTVAVKRIRYVPSRADEYAKTIDEYLTLHLLSHENIVPLLGVVKFDDPVRPIPCIVTPWMENGNMIEYLQRFTTPSSKLLERLIHGTAKGLNYLHGMNVVHGDLRGVNILIDKDETPRLADFGLSRILNEHATQVATQNHQGGRWTAPELLCPERFLSQNNPTSKPTCEGDVYSFACVCYEIYTTKPPFHEIRREATVIVRVLNGQRPRRPVKCDGYAIVPSDKIWSLIEECWDQQSHNRPTMSAVLQRLDDTRLSSYKRYRLRPWWPWRAAIREWRPRICNAMHELWCQ